MKIVVLDGYALNPGDLSWDAFRSLGEMTIYDRTPLEHIVDRAREAEVVLTNKTPLSSETLHQLSHLRYIGVLATGYNVVDVKAANEQGITVTNIPTYGTASVAQYVFALILECCHQVGRHYVDVREGGWPRNPDFSYWLTPQMELHGKTLGIVGFGRIGREVAHVAFAFGMQVCVVRSARAKKDEASGDARIAEVTLEELLRSADIVTLHCPLTPETAGLINHERLAWMKPTAILINTSRGGLVAEADLADALNAKRLYAAGLDVLSVEPPDASNPLLRARNCIVTPHIAWATREARSRLMATAAANLRAYLQGSPQNRIPPA